MQNHATKAATAKQATAEKSTARERGVFDYRKPPITRERLPARYWARARAHASPARDPATEVRQVRDSGAMAARTREIIEALVLNRRKLESAHAVEMPLGSPAGTPFRHYRRMSLKRMQELRWVAAAPGRFRWVLVSNPGEPEEYKGERDPSRVVVYEKLLERLAKVAIPSVPVGRPKQQQLHALNKFIAGHQVTGCPQVRLGLHTLTNEGKPYGRIHAACAHGMSYQQLSLEDRALIRFDGYPTVELDLGSSQIRILAALMGYPMATNEDPYFILGIDRQVVKQWWVSTAFNANRRPPTNWHFTQAAEEHDVSDWPEPSTITAAMYHRYPWLQERGWDSDRLVGIEAKVTNTTVEILADQDVLALPIHDSIRVRTDQAALAERVLRQQWAKYVNAPCVTKLKGQGPEKTPTQSDTIEALAAEVMKGFEGTDAHSKQTRNPNIWPRPAPALNKRPSLSQRLLCASRGGFRRYYKLDQRTHALELLATGNMTISAVVDATGLHRNTVSRMKAKLSTTTELDV